MGSKQVPHYTFRARSLILSASALVAQALALLAVGALLLGRTLFVGLSARSSPAGIEQLARLVGPYGYSVTSVPVHGCLHLKTAVTQVGPDTLLLNPNRLDPTVFGSFRHVEVDPDEPDAANALWIRGVVIFPAETGATARRLEKAGIRVRRMEISELARAEAGVTCCSLVFESRPQTG